MQTITHWGRTRWMCCRYNLSNDRIMLCMLIARLSTVSVIWRTHHKFSYCDLQKLYSLPTKVRFAYLEFILCAAEPAIMSKQGASVQSPLFTPYISCCPVWLGITVLFVLPRWLAYCWDLLAGSHFYVTRKYVSCHPLWCMIAFIHFHYFDDLNGCWPYYEQDYVLLTA